MEKRQQFDPLELLKEIIVVVLATAGVFAWVLLVQLIISFVALSYVKMKLKIMLFVAGAAAFIFAVFFIVGRIRRKRR